MLGRGEKERMADSTHRDPPGTEPVRSDPRPVAPAPAAAATDWEAVRQSSEFRDLVRSKRRFIIPATAFFLVWYLLLPLGNGLAPELMKTRVIGNINLAYLFALSEFVMTWLITYLYIQRSEHVFDGLAAKVRQRIPGAGA